MSRTLPTSMEFPKVPLTRELARLPVELLSDGLTLSWDFGLASLTELARTATLAGLNVLESGSVRAEEGGVVFTLRNPPLRIGASRAVRVFWDREPLDPQRVRVEVRGQPPGTRLSAVSGATPLTIPVGLRTDFHLEGAASAEGKHRLRLELDPIAIPPMLFWETEVRIGKAGVLGSVL